jgi:hypothetical protein
MRDRVIQLADELLNAQRNRSWTSLMTLPSPLPVRVYSSQFGHHHMTETISAQDAETNLSDTYRATIIQTLYPDSVRTNHLHI